MSFIKPDKKIEERDPVAELMCSVLGCPNRWSVKVDGDKPKCSKHQWGEKPMFKNYTEPKEPEFD